MPSQYSFEGLIIKSSVATSGTVPGSGIGMVEAVAMIYRGTEETINVIINPFQNDDYKIFIINFTRNDGKYFNYNR